MIKFIERLFFFAFTPMSFLWASLEGYRSLIESNVCAGQASGCAFAALSFPFLIAFSVVGIGLAIRYGRIKKEKATTP